MAVPKKLLLRANWGGRPGSLETEVEMVWEFMRRLAAHGGFLAVPWYSVGGRGPDVPLASREALAADMLRTRTSGDGPDYSFTQDTYQEVDNPPHASLNATLSNPVSSGLITANQVVVGLETDVVYSDLPEEAARWLLGLGVQLVEDMVDVWQPDVVSLDSRDLVLLGRQLFPRGAFPTIGYVSWLSNVVMDAAAVPSAPIRQEYEGGALFGIDPGSADPVGEATRLAMGVFSSGMLRPIPKIQGRPDPEPPPPAAPAAPLRRGLFGGRR